MATFASSPALLNGYVGLDTAWEKSSFSAQERQLIFLAASVENRCRYCIATHATALKGLKVNPQCIQAVRNRVSLGNQRLDALVTLTRELVLERGFVAPRTRRRFVAAGFNEVALMEVLIGAALKVMSNYLDNLAPIALG
jgi:AhpD family alkylhydroperoxidase